MAKSIVLIGTLDTKGDALGYLHDLVAELGEGVAVVDTGILGEVAFPPTVAREEVARAAGSSIAEIVELCDEDRAMRRMALGAARLVAAMCSRGEVAGVLAVGGSMGTALALEVMRELPVGLPKVLLSTVAYSPVVSPELLDVDVTMVPWTAGLWGLNSLSEEALRTAAGAVVGAARLYEHRDGEPRRKVVAVTSLGRSITRYLEWLKPELEARGYEVAVFQATGMSGRLLERAVSAGRVDAVLDLCVGTELVAGLTGGANAAGATRLTAAGRRGIPQIVSPGGLEFFHWPTERPLPASLEGRPKHRHNALLDVILSSLEERRAVGAVMAGRLNEAAGPVAVIVPIHGMRSEAVLEEQVADRSVPLDPFFTAIMHPEDGFAAFLEELHGALRADIETVVVDSGMNDPQYANEILARFDAMTGSRH